MLAWLQRHGRRPWVARIVCGVLFLAAMAALRIALVALRDTHDTPLIAAIGLPIIAACIAFGFWYDRRH